MALPGFDTASNPAPERVSNGVPRAGHHARLHGRARALLGIDPGPLAARLRRAAVDRTRHPEPRHGRRLTRDPPPSGLGGYPPTVDPLQRSAAGPILPWCPAAAGGRSWPPGVEEDTSWRQDWRRETWLSSRRAVAAGNCARDRSGCPRRPSRTVRRRITSPTDRSPSRSERRVPAAREPLEALHVPHHLRQARPQSSGGGEPGFEPAATP